MTFVKGSTCLLGQVIKMTMAPAINARITAMTGPPSPARILRVHVPNLDAGGRSSDASGCLTGTAMLTSSSVGRRLRRRRFEPSNCSLIITLETIRNKHYSEEYGFRFLHRRPLQGDHKETPLL